jgi:hypothetical protein
VEDPPSPDTGVSRKDPLKFDQLLVGVHFMRTSPVLREVGLVRAIASHPNIL